MVTPMQAEMLLRPPTPGSRSCRRDPHGRCGALA